MRGSSINVGTYVWNHHDPQEKVEDPKSKGLISHFSKVQQLIGNPSTEIRQSHRTEKAQKKNTTA